MSLIIYRRIIRNVPNIPPIYIYVVSRWDPNDDALFLELELDISIPIIVWGDGTIASGKSTFVEYITQQLKKHCSSLYDRVISAPSPIEEIRKLTKPYYKKKASLDEASKKICELCRNNWVKHLPLEPVPSWNKSLIIEHLPPPFHSWIFNRPFGTTLVEEAASQRMALNSNTSKVLNDYIKGNILLDTLKQHQRELSHFKRAVVVLFRPTIDTIMLQLHQRDRPEERVITIGYMKYLASRFDRAIWELFERHKLSRSEIMERLRYLCDIYP